MRKPIWVLLAFLLAFALPPKVEAQGRPTYIIAFIPLNWAGSRDAFERAAQEQAAYFAHESGIDQFADVQFLYLREGMRGDPQNALLDVEVTAFGMRTAAADRYIGLTDGDLAPDGDASIVGWTRGPGAHGMVVEVVEPNVTAHELGHTYGLCDEYLFEVWRGQDNAITCPNPFPVTCEARAGVWCAGLPTADGRYSIMGPAGLDGAHGYNDPSLDHLGAEFAALFGEPVTATPTPPATSTPQASPTPTPALSGGAPLLLSNPALLMVDGEGGARTLAEAPALHPVMSPDGRWVVFAAPYAGTYDLWRVPVRGGSAEALTRGAGNEWHPAFSPDGTRLYYDATGSGGNGIHLLDNASGTDLPLSALPDGAGDPHISVDGRLWFTAAPGGVWGIYSAILDSAGLPVGGSVTLVLETGEMAVAPSLSPGGTHLLFSALEGESMRLYQFTLADGSVTPLTDGGGSAWGARWLDDAQLVYQESSGDGMRIVLLDPRSGVRVTRYEGHFAAWAFPLPDVFGGMDRRNP